MMRWFLPVDWLARCVAGVNLGADFANVVHGCFGLGFRLRDLRQQDIAGVMPIGNNLERGRAFFSALSSSGGFFVMYS